MVEIVKFEYGGDCEAHRIPLEDCAVIEMLVMLCTICSMLVALYW